MSGNRLEPLARDQTTFKILATRVVRNTRRGAAMLEAGSQSPNAVWNWYGRSRKTRDRSEPRASIAVGKQRLPGRWEEAQICAFVHEFKPQPIDAILLDTRVVRIGGFA